MFIIICLIAVGRNELGKNISISTEQNKQFSYGLNLVDSILHPVLALNVH